MKKSKLLSVILAVLILTVFSVSACSSGTATDNTSGTSTVDTSETSTAETTSGTSAETKPAFEKYDPPIEITSCRVRASWMGFDPGEDENNNWWTKTFMDQLGVKFTQIWTAPNWGTDYDQKFNVALATNSLPDCMMYLSDYEAMKVINAGKAADLAQLFNDYASPEVKRITGVLDGQSLKAWTIDGKLYGIAQPANPRTEYPYVWIRSDWLKALNLSVPETMADLENVAAQFVAKNPGKAAEGNYGIALTKNLSHVYKPLAYAFQASQYWIESGGKLVYGPTQPEFEKAWEKAAQWYKAGIFPKDFAVKDPTSAIEQDVLANKVGILLGETNEPNGATLRDWCKMNQNNDMDWVYVRMPSGTDNPTTVSKSSSYTSPLLVSSECKHPEAVIEMLNLTTAIFGNDKPDFVENAEFNTSKGGNMVWWDVLSLRLDDTGSQEENYQKIEDAIKQNLQTSDLPLALQDSFNLEKSWLNDGYNAENFDLGWSLIKLSGPGGSLRDQNALYDAHPELFKFSPFWGSATATITKYSADWGSKEQEYATKAIMSGDAGTVQKEFNNWVEYFNKNGGPQAEAEVNEWYAAHK